MMRFRSGLVFLLAALFLPQLAPPLAATVLSLNPPVAVASPGCLELSPDVAALPGGGFVAVWQGGTDLTGTGQIQGRIFGRGDNPLGASFRVSSGQGVQPAVAVRPDGRFLVVWRDRTGSGIRARLFEPTGAPAAAETTVDGFGAESTRMDVAALPDGRFAVTWNGQASISLGVVDADGQSRLPSFEAEGYAGFEGVDPRAESPAIAVQPDGDLVLVWTVRNASFFEFWEVDGLILPSATSSDNVRRLHFDLGGNPGKIMEATVGVDGAGNIVVAWKEDARGPAPARIAVQLLDPLGQPRRPAFRADENALWERVGGPTLAVTPDGAFAVAWDARVSPENLSPPFPSNQVYTRVFDAAGNALGLTRVIAPADGTSGLDGIAPALAWVEGREFVVAWQEAFPNIPAAGCFSEGIVARRFFTACLPGPNRLCLGDGRFQLGVTWNAPNAGSGTGKAVTLTRDTGYFWFFGPENVELVVKVLDGRTVNNHFWVFYGSLSDVAWNLTVKDLVTGGERFYGNPQGQLASRGDTLALAASSADTVEGAEGVSVQTFDSFRLDREALPGGPAEALVPAAGAAAPAGAPVLTLNDDFQVDVAWKDPFNGGSGIGQGVPLTGDSGYFWFFDPDNVELAVKVLDGRAVNGKYWVFYGALTNVEYDLRVRFGGKEKVYHNPPFQFLSRADTAAFDGN
jgi:hypothetical protein